MIIDALERKACDEEFHDLYEELMALPIPESSAYIEPSTLEQIHAQRPHGPRKFDCNLDDDQLYNRIYGAWLGRAAGCALGKPVEGWPKARIDGYLAEMGIEQLDDYIPFHEKKIPSILKTSTRGNIAYMDRDDDMDFPILGLLALERRVMISVREPWRMSGLNICHSAPCTLPKTLPETLSCPCGHRSRELS